jgi:uncharacterized protein with HEPN domain
MSDSSLVLEHLNWMIEAIERIERRFGSIDSPGDFLSSEHGLDMLDSICMMLLELGESAKRIERHDNGALYDRTPQIPWRKMIGIRNFLGHGYPDVNEMIIFDVCRNHIPTLKAGLIRLIDELGGDLSQDHA